MTLTNALALTFASSLVQHRYLLWTSSVESQLQIASFVKKQVRVLRVK